MEREDGKSENSLFECLCYRAMTRTVANNNKKTKKGGDQKSRQVKMVSCYKSQKENSGSRYS